jgi:hypothetical protein
MTKIVYTLYTEDPLSTSPFPKTDDLLFATHATSKPHPIIINSRTSSHIHLNLIHFIPFTLKPTTSIIKGFSRGSAKIESCREFQLLAQRPRNGQAHLSLAKVNAWVSPTTIMVHIYDQQKDHTHQHQTCQPFISSPHSCQGTLAALLARDAKVTLNGVMVG